MDMGAPMERYGGASWELEIFRKLKVLPLSLSLSFLVLYIFILFITWDNICIISYLEGIQIAAGHPLDLVTLVADVGRVPWPAFLAEDISLSRRPR